MGVLTGLMSRARSTELGHPSTDRSWTEFVHGGATAPRSNVVVTEKTAVTLSAVWGCIRAISEDTAKLPLKVYRRNADGSKEVLADHPLTRILNRKASPYQTAINFREGLVAQALLWQGGFAEIERSGSGRVVALHPIEPERVSTRLTRNDDGQTEIEYEVSNQTREATGLSQTDVIHLRGLGFNGVDAYRVVRIARESLGLTAAAEHSGAAFFGSGMRPGGVFTHPGKPNDVARSNIIKSLKDQYGGFEKFGQWMLLWEGMTAQQLAIDPKDAQFLETRAFQIPECCRWFRMKPHKVADLSNATYSNIEHQDLEYVGDCLMGWMVRLEQELWDKLLTEDEKDQGIFIEHVAAALLRGDLKSRYEAYAIGRNWGWLSADEVKARENENSLPDGLGESYLIPSNMVRADLLPGAPEADAGIRSVVSGFQPVLAEAFGRVLRTEADKASRAHRRDELEDWSGTFYATHAEHVRAALFPAIESIARAAAVIAGETFNGVPEELRSHLAMMAERHIQTSREQLSAGVDAAVTRWKGDRGEMDADRALPDLIAATLAAYPQTEE